MKDLLPTIQDWMASHKKFAIATVVDTWRSAPRMVGSAMLISEDLEIIGSVSGGCVEGSVIKQARETMQNGQAKLLMFGVSNEDAWTVGLSCGGKIKVFVEPFFGQRADDRSQELWQKMVQNLHDDLPFVLTNQIHDQAKKTLVEPSQGDESISKELHKHALQALQKGESELIAIDQMPYFLHVFPRRNHLIIIGAAHVSGDLVSLAQDLDFKTTVIDPRGLFADNLRSICTPEELVKGWPEEVLPKIDLGEHVYAVTLTHDPKIDDQALRWFLKSQVAYIGALGSKKTHAKRISRLQAAGFDSTEIDKIHGPIGLDIGARSAREIAVSIIAQIIATYRKKPNKEHLETHTNHPF